MKKKETKTTVNAIEKLHKIINYLEFYFPSGKEWKNIIKDSIFIEEHLIELSTDKKIDHARFAKKYKKLWMVELEELKIENKLLKQKLERLS